MKSVIAIIITAIMGLIGIFFGNEQKRKRKAAEDKSRKLEAELKLQQQQAEISESIHSNHVQEVVSIATMPEGDLVSDANNLFNDDLTSGKILERARMNQGLSLTLASKMTGYTVRRLIEIEKDINVSKDEIERLCKAYRIDRDVKNTMLAGIRPSDTEFKKK